MSKTAPSYPPLCSWTAAAEDAPHLGLAQAALAVKAVTKGEAACMVNTDLLQRAVDALLHGDTQAHAMQLAAQSLQGALDTAVCSSMPEECSGFLQALEPAASAALAQFMQLQVAQARQELEGGCAAGETDAISTAVLAIRLAASACVKSASSSREQQQCQAVLNALYGDVLAMLKTGALDQQHEDLQWATAQAAIAGGLTVHRLVGMLCSCGLGRAACSSFLDPGTLSFAAGVCRKRGGQSGPGPCRSHAAPHVCRVQPAHSYCRWDGVQGTASICPCLVALHVPCLFPRTSSSASFPIPAHDMNHASIQGQRARRHWHRWRGVADHMSVLWRRWGSTSRQQLLQPTTFSCCKRWVGIATAKVRPLRVVIALRFTAD